MNTLQAEQIRDFIAAIQEKSGVDYVNIIEFIAEGNNHVTLHIDQYFTFPVRGIGEKT